MPLRPPPLLQNKHIYEETPANAGVSFCFALCPNACHCRILSFMSDTAHTQHAAHLSRHITRESFFKYLKCPSWIAHDQRTGAKDDALRLRLQQDGLLPDVERTVVRTRSPHVTEVVVEDLDDAQRETLEAMARGDQTIYGGVLVWDRFVARPDILERVQGASQLGAHYYVACDVKRSRYVKDEYKIQGCFYADVLEKVQGVKPHQGYVLRQNGEVESYLLADVEVKYRLSLDAIERILMGEQEPHFLTTDCKQSPWFHECAKDALACDDLSRLNRVWRSETKELAEAGFGTIAQLADAHPDHLASRVKGIARERLQYIHSQAQALVAGKIIRVGQTDLPESDVALVIDIESDPLRHAHYLFGVLHVDGDTAEYHAFLAKDPRDEEAAWRGFIAFVRGFIGVPFYHYGSYEVDVYRDMSQKYGTEPEVLLMLEEQSVDLLVRLRESVIFPLSFFSLKDIAQHLGFRWRHDDASGLNSVLWYEDWLATKSEKMLQTIIDYNEDDVRATWHAARWAMEQKDRI